VVDEIPARPLRLVDLAGEEPGPLTAEFRRLAEEGVAHPIADPKPDKRASVFTRLERVVEARGGPERAAELFIATENARTGSGAPCTHSLTLALAILESIPAAVADPLASIREACPQWAKVLEEIQRLPVNPLSPGVLESLFLTLRARLTDGVLELTARDAWHRNAMEDLYLPLIREGVAKFVGRDVTVSIIAPPAAAAGGTP
jgi:hypothetical protein